MEELFEKQPRRWQTSELQNEVYRIYKERGGTLGSKQPPGIVITKALADLIGERKIRRVRRGYIEPSDADSDDDDDAAGPAEAKSDAEIAAEIGPLKTIGQGTESVYVYYFQNDKELANFKGRSMWECKIGEGKDVLGRVKNQSKTARAYPPVVALEIKSSDRKALEGTIHKMLRLADRSIDEGQGDEWFITNPSEVESCYRAIDVLVQNLRNGAPAL